MKLLFAVYSYNDVCVYYWASTPFNKGAYYSYFTNIECGLVESWIIGTRHDGLLIKPIKV